ncbi:CBS domain-containing protein [Glaciihabitans arcticus]|uniref:CBS domain-containing protein n=1 Tax=Glaciihabitans arcticus TaxID=2668039 RepID=A0A4Q9GMG4_9MICO|nr:nucleotidyltransferase family protein [Glaciihabitans arcticus]TBN55962.1 CBS domain-containing protein [Glaciihabitans arcticus]
MDITAVSVAPEASVRDVIAAIDASRRQIALIVDADSRLQGVVTDGDVRRGILRGVSLEAPATEIMNPKPHTATVLDEHDDMVALMKKFEIRHLPVLDVAGRLVDLFAGEDGRSHVVSTPVVLMAGGRGQRLYPLTKDVPKPMLPIGDVPLLEIILRNLAAQGFVNVYISVNYLAEVIEQHVGDGSALGLKVTYVHEDKPLGTAGALAQLHGVIGEPFVVMNSDLLTHVNLRRLLNFHLKQRAIGTVGVREHVFEIPYGVVNLDGARVESMVEKPLHRSLVNAGIYALDPSALALLPEDEYCDMPTLLGLIMQQGDTVSAFPIHEQWLDVGRPEDLNQARSDSEKWTNS